MYQIVETRVSILSGYKILRLCILFILVYT